MPWSIVFATVLWHQYFYHDWFQDIYMISLTVVVGRDVHSWLLWVGVSRFLHTTGLIPKLFKLFESIDKEVLLNSFYEVHKVFTEKLTRITEKITTVLISSMNIGTKVLNKVILNNIQQHTQHSKTSWPAELYFKYAMKFQYLNIHFSIFLIVLKMKAIIP